MVQRQGKYKKGNERGDATGHTGFFNWFSKSKQPVQPKTLARAKKIKCDVTPVQTKTVLSHKQNPKVSKYEKSDLTEKRSRTSAQRKYQEPRTNKQHHSKQKIAHTEVESQVPKKPKKRFVEPKYLSHCDLFLPERSRQKEQHHNASKPSKRHGAEPKRSNKHKHVSKPNRRQDSIKQVVSFDTQEPKKRKDPLGKMANPTSSAHDIGFAVVAKNPKQFVTTKSGKEGVLLDFAHDENETVGILQMNNGKVTIRGVHAFNIEDDEKDSSESDEFFDLADLRAKSLRVTEAPRRSTNYVLARGTTDHKRTLVTSVPLVREAAKDGDSFAWKTEKRFWFKANLDRINESRLRPFPAETPELLQMGVPKESSAEMNIRKIVPAGVEPKVQKGKVISETYMWKRGKVQKWCFAYKSECTYLSTITINFNGSHGLQFKSHSPDVKIYNDTIVEFKLPPFEKIIALTILASGAYSVQYKTKKKYEHVDESASKPCQQAVDLQLAHVQSKIRQMKRAGNPKGKSVIHWCHDIGLKFIDLEFPPVTDSVYEKETHLKRENVIFRRATDIWDDVQIFQNNTARHDDVEQGKLGDCWLMSAAAAVADHLDLIDVIFLTQEMNEAGVHQIKLCTSGMWETFTLDSFLPCNANGELIYTRAHNHALWPSLIEKAFAKYYGTYEHVEAHDPAIALAYLTGKPTHSWILPETDEDEMWHIVNESSSSHHDLITICTHSQPEKERLLNNTGLVANHAYTILRAEEGLGQRLLEIRNPWGRHEWRGKWSDHSKMWTRKYIDHFKPDFHNNNGTFWMCFRDVEKYFEKVTVCYCETEARVYRMPLHCGYDRRGEVRFYTMNIKVPRGGNLEWIGLHQVDEQAAHALPFDPLILMAFTIHEGKRVPIKLVHCHKAYKCDQIQLQHGNYELVIFHCDRRHDASEDNHTATVTLHGHGPKFIVKAEEQSDVKMLKRALVDFARGFGEKKVNRELTEYIYDRNNVNIWVAENTQDLSSRTKYLARISASMKSRNKVFASFVQDPENINVKLGPGEADLLTVAVTGYQKGPASMSRSKRVHWERVSYDNTHFYE